MEKISTEIGKGMSLSEDEMDNLAIALTEAVGNAIVHGNKKDPRKKVTIVVHAKGKQSVLISVSDQGKGFDPKQLMNPTSPENLMKESGRGIFILKALMDDVTFSFGPYGTTLTFLLKKKRASKA